MRIPKLIEEHKSVFGAYLTMALSNVETVLNHIAERAELDRYEWDEDHGVEDYWEHPVMQYLVENDKPWSIPSDVLLDVRNRLFRSFPFLKIMAENQRNYRNSRERAERVEISKSDIFVVLNNSFRVLKAYRDTCTHYLIENRIWEDDSKMLKYNECPLAAMVNQYYTAALRVTKERYGYETRDLAFIQDRQFVPEKDRNGKTIVTKYGKEKKKVVPDLDFFLSLEAINGDSNKRLHLSGWGVALLICLFLEKKYVNVFLSKLPNPGNYPPSSKESRIIRRSMGVCSVVLPKERIHSEAGELSAALDMLNELKRCPRELFDTLSSGNQKRFRTISSDHNEVLQMRSKDRFAQLVLQYIDHNRLFDGLRFHVNMGKLRYLFNPKKYCIDGQTRVRVLEHPLNGFGRLQEMEKERLQEDGTFADSGIKVRCFDEVRRDDANESNYPYIVDTYTHYILENDMVEMFFCPESSGMEMPIVTSGKGKLYVEKKVPHCRMSVLELPAMLFHLLLCGAKNTEAHIGKVCDNYCHLFSDMAQGNLTEENILSYGIKKEDIPQKVWDCVRGVHMGKDSRAYREKEIRERYEDAERRLERLEADRKAVLGGENKIGKRGFVQIVPGRLAVYLATDICRLQPSLRKGDGYGTDRLTGLNFRLLQSSIATYNCGEIDILYGRFRDVFCSAGLIGGDNPHPFLDKVLPEAYSARCPRNTIEFYERYLKEYLRYLVPLVKKLEMGKIPYVPFVNECQRRWARRDEAYYQDLANLYLSQAIELPRQMFDAEIKDKLRDIPEMMDVDFDHANVTFLIGEYLKRVCHDEPQGFYSWSRHYKYIDMLKCILDPKKGSLQAVYTQMGEREGLWQERSGLEEKYARIRLRDLGRKGLDKDEANERIKTGLGNRKKEYQKAEKVIRRYKVQDALLFMLAKDTLLKSVEVDDERFKLKDIMPDGEKGILSEVVPMDFRFMVPVWENGCRKAQYMSATLHSDEMKIKNYGDFFALARDKRMKTLLPIVGYEVKKKDVENEFDKYDDCRPEMIAMVFDFERWAYETYPELKELVTDNENRGSLFSALLGQLLNMGELTREEKYALTGIRNAFCHNSYPTDSSVVEVNELPKIAEYLKELFKEYIGLE